MALETQSGHPMTGQQLRIRGTVWNVAVDAPVELLRRMGIDERAGLLGVTIEANPAAANHREPALAVVAVHRVAIGALEGPGAVTMGVRHLE